MTASSLSIPVEAVRCIMHLSDVPIQFTVDRSIASHVASGLPPHACADSVRAAVSLHCDVSQGESCRGTL
jgi:hypothetical protein